jgi:hypothetical protein
MIHHIVLFEFADHVSNTDVESIFEQLNSRRELFKIQSFIPGFNVSQEGLSRGLKHGFIMGFATEADVSAYVHHPEHKRIVEIYIIPALKRGVDKSVLVFDLKA